MSLQQLTPDKFFYSNDGKVFTSIEELYRGLKEMSEETFLYHVNKEKNDFYNWIKFVVNYDSFAKSIQKVKTRSGFLRKAKEFVSA
ncbi:hypothetical protein [Sporocytophaga myxococcoides]|uniref:hypothetical protein n=1 Tax=Sporocytophaga myxococcoides TaxID=153721 RepID=UPI0004102F63|nr:hypothetical protein [Sporocytophaga myxococcoides]